MTVVVKELIEQYNRRRQVQQYKRLVISDFLHRRFNSGTDYPINGAAAFTSTS